MGSDAGLLIHQFSCPFPVRLEAFTLDETFVIAGDEGGMISVWELETGRCRQRFKAHDAPINTLSATSSLVASGDHSGAVRAWNYLSGELYAEFGHRAGLVTSVKMVIDSDRLLSASGALVDPDNRLIKIHRLSTGREIAVLRGHNDAVEALDVTANGRFAVSASIDRTLRVWDLNSATVENAFSGHRLAVTDLRYVPEMGYVISASADKTLKLWDLKQRVDVYTFPEHSTGIVDLHISQGTYVVSHSNEVRVWDIELRKEVSAFSFKNSGQQVSVFADGSNVVTGLRNGAIKLWNLRSGTLVRELEGHGSDILKLAVSPDCQSIVSACAKYLKIWNAADGRLIHEILLHRYLTSLLITPDSQYVILTYTVGPPEKWSIGTGELVATYVVDPQTRLMITAYTTHAIFLLACDDRFQLHVWDFETGTPHHALGGHTGFVPALHSLSDGFHVVSVSLDGSVKLWDLVNGTCMATFSTDSELWACDVTPDDTCIICGGTSGHLYFLQIEGLNLVHKHQQ